MRLTDDISNRRWLLAKGWLFLFLAIAAGLLLWGQSPTIQTGALLLITIWASCRFYYFLFYVLEKYAGRCRPYAGLFDALSYLVRPAGGAGKAEDSAADKSQDTR